MVFSSLVLISCNQRPFDTNLESFHDYSSPMDVIYSFTQGKVSSIPIGSNITPPSPDYVPGPEEPEQAPPSPDYVPGPEHDDDEIVAEDQPYAKTANS
ncbi:hypothetical protein Tco_0966096 [Tanacetum coccineum]